ncbi:MAG: NAD(P)-binding protein [Rhodospirillaceae bacterium]|nr:NAD(P)-binding protein [Rhodospirillaceae bacterium]
MTAGDRTILIAGAGLGGLTAALALLRRGFRVTVLEQAPALGEVGAGVQIGANGMCVLDHLGLWPALEPLAWQPEGKRIYHYRTGESWPLYDLGAESVERYGFPYCMFHRADLHAVLAGAVAEAQPDAVRLDAKLAGVEQDGIRATAVLEGGERVSGAALVGADGIHSVVRRALFGPDDPQFTGIVAWRGVVPTADLPARLLEPQSAIWIGPGGHCVHYQLRNGALMNFVGAIERSDWRIESWNTPGAVAECLRDFDGWSDTLRSLIRALPAPYKWALHVRESMEAWSKGRITLLGDACHATLPFLAQGANHAIEDGLVLARALDAFVDVETAFRRYEAARLERTTRMVRGSTANTARFHNPKLADPEETARIAREEFDPAAVAARHDWLFEYNAVTAAI